ncbi:MAG: T9SS type A sorting domain-containing protein [bacterium]|nr:T9SS type A sorting domain-containing protein [bacterium]
MKRAVFSFIFMMTASTLTFGQLSTPNVEAVYGGRILGITGYAKTTDSVRIFISTESANTLFYADAHSNTASPSGTAFSTISAVDADDNYGSAVKTIEAHAGSGYVFFAHNSEGLMKVDVNSSSPTQITMGYVPDMLFKGDTLVYLNANKIFTATVNGSANVTSLVSDITPGISPGMQKLDIHPINGSVYVFSEGSTPELMKSDDNLSSLTSSSTFSAVSTSSLSSSVRWKTFGIAPSGRIFVFGDDNMDKYVAYTDDESTWTSSKIASGVTGSNVAFHGDSSSYSVYHAKLYNNTNGEGSWNEFGNVSQETHPNDGPVFADPLNDNMVFLTTDQGIGLSINGGSSIFEIDDGVEAVQVQDFDMIASKNEGWMASKSGIRKVSDFLSSPSWSGAMFPQGDGSPYFSIEIDPSDTNRVYAGNIRVYQTTDEGASWNRIFTPEQAPYNLPHVGTKARAIEVSPYDSSLIFAAYEVQDSLQGGLFYSTDRGANWEQLLLEESAEGEDTDVTDVVFTIENGDSIVYVSALYDLDHPSGRSIYKITKSGSGWNVSQDMNGGTTSTGSLIVASIWDLELTVTGDTVIAVGTDAGINHPIAYYKALDGDNLWTPMTTSGFPFEEGKLARAVSIGEDTLFVAVDNEVYYHVLGESSWNLGHSYPVGTEINVLFYDELLVGTGIGLFSHFNSGTTVSNEESANSFPNRIELNQNYPNPFNPSTNIQFSIPHSGLVKLEVFNVLGQKVASLIDQPMSAGSHTINFNARGLSSGIYIYKLAFGEQVSLRKMLLIK